MNSSACLDHPFVSVIVCTLGNRPSLWNCLRSLQGQQCSNFEVLLALNGPPDAEFAQAIKPYAVRLINEPRRGVSKARNRAVPQAKGEILAFADDDVVARADWLHELLKGFEDPRVQCVTGLIAPAGPVPHSLEKAARYFAGSRAQSAWVLGNTEADWLQQAIGEPIGFGCNMAFRKSFLDQYSLFPEDLGAGSVIGGGDEFWMFIQVLKRGFRIYHTPSAVVTHLYEPDEGRQKQRMMQIYSGTVAFAMKLFAEERSLRGNALRWLYAGLKRRLRQVISRRSVSSEPQELLTSLDKLRAYLRGPFVYWRRRAGASSR
jgi:GT2 family glycosyltransferase